MSASTLEKRVQKGQQLPGIPPHARRRASRASQENRAALRMLIPWFLGLIFIVIGPLLASLYLAFTSYDLLTAPQWIGFENFRTMFTEDPRYIAALGVTAKYVFISVPLQLGFALVLALVLNRGVRGLAIYRSVYYLPSLIGTSVAIAILWRRVFGHSGLFNLVIGALGADGKSWISDPASALSTLIVLNVWTFGSPMIIFLAGLRQIPEMYYEAAAIDGASRFDAFRRITLPLLTPIVFFNLILQLISAFRAFTPAFIVSGGTGGPINSTLFYTLYLYQEGFSRFRMGYASAMAWVLVGIIAVFTAINFLASKYWVFYGDE